MLTWIGEVREKMFVRFSPLRPKNLIEHQFVDLIPEQCIRERIRIAPAALSEPLYRRLCQLVQPHWAKPLLTVDEQCPIFRTEGIVDRWARKSLPGRGKL